MAAIGWRGGTRFKTQSSSVAQSPAMPGDSGNFVGSPAGTRSMIVRRVSVVVPWRAKTRPSMAAVKMTRARSCSLTKDSPQVGLSGDSDAPVIAIRRPPSARRASADDRCRKAASRTRPSTCAPTENGGFIKTMVGRTFSSRWSWMAAASKRVTFGLVNRDANSAARVGENSFRASLAPASSAKIASSPVPADGSRTRSLDVILAARLATNPSPIGVENCCSAWLSSERRVCVGSSAAILASIARRAAGDCALARIAGPSLRKVRTVAASQAS